MILMKNNVRIGSLGEDIALLYLQDRGYRVIDRNFRKSWGELDIVAMDPEGILVFVEVKTAKRPDSDSEYSGISPEDNMSRAKIMKTKKIAESYSNAHPESVDDNKGWRIDLVAIRLGLRGLKDFPGRFSSLTEINKYCEIKHLENVE